MAESLILPDSSDRKSIYTTILPQIKSVVAGESDLIANMANISAMLKEAFGFFWIGFYRNIEDELVLGPFQGPLACTRIPNGKGVCGASKQQKKSFIVPDVEKFPGHIACSSLSKSEIVIPGINSEGIVEFILDIDSDVLDDFDEIDQTFLEKVVSLIL